MTTLDDLIAAREAEIEGLRGAAERIAYLEGELDSLQEQHAGEIEGVREEWWRDKRGVYLIRDDGFTRCSPRDDWTPEQLRAWVALTPSVNVVAAIVNAVENADEPAI